MDLLCKMMCCCLIDDDEEFDKPTVNETAHSNYSKNLISYNHLTPVDSDKDESGYYEIEIIRGEPDGEESNNNSTSFTYGLKFVSQREIDQKNRLDQLYAPDPTREFMKKDNKIVGFNSQIPKISDKRPPQFNLDKKKRKKESLK